MGEGEGAYFISLKQDFSLNLELANLVRPAAIKTQVCSCLLFTGVGMTEVVLNLWVVTSLGVYQFFHRGHLNTSENTGYLYYDS